MPAGSGPVRSDQEEAGVARKPARGEKPRKRPEGKAPQVYTHPKETLLLRPDVGLQPQFKGKKPAKVYRYDPSLDPALSWDVNVERERGETLIARIEAGKDLGNAKAAAAELRRMSRAFLNWTGKAERQEFTVPSCRSSSISGCPPRPSSSRSTRTSGTASRRSPSSGTGLGGQVQMIYIDPPYGVRFGSSFQPFVRRRDVKHGDDENLTREPEMIQGYRDVGAGPSLLSDPPAGSDPAVS
jgi:adenine-specific DNA-methyltransferase